MTDFLYISSNVRARRKPNPAKGQNLRQLLLRMNIELVIDMRLDFRPHGSQAVALYKSCLCKTAKERKPSTALIQTAYILSFPLTASLS